MKWLFYAFLLGFASVAMAQEQVFIQASKDNTIESKSHVSSNGSGPVMFIGRTADKQDKIFRGLIAFDLEPIPDGAVIKTATLTIHVDLSASGNNRSFSAFRLTNDWGEGASVGETGRLSGAMANDATWVDRFFDKNLLWDQEGGDFVGAPSSISDFPGDDENLLVFSSSELALDVQRWVDGEGGNFGWILQGDERMFSSALRVHSSESTIASLRPTLRVDYLSPVNVAPIFGDVEVKVSGGTQSDTEITRLEAEDPEGDPLTYTIVQGNESNTFYIDEDRLVLATALALATYELQIRISDSFGNEISGTVKVLVDFAPFFPDASITTDSEVVGGDVLAKLAAIDPEEGRMTYRIISGNEAGLFRVEDDLLIATMTPIPSIYPIQIGATDLFGNETVALYSIKVLPLPLNVSRERPRFRVFPNPASSETGLTIESVGAGIAMYAMDGQLLKITYKKSLSISEYRPGIYFLKALSSNDIEKLIIK